MFILTEEFFENYNLVWLFLAKQQTTIAKKRSFCGHDRYVPRFPTCPEHHKARHSLLEELIKKACKKEIMPLFDGNKQGVSNATTCC